MCDATCYLDERANCVLREDAYGIEPTAFNVNVYGGDFEDDWPRVVSPRDDDNGDNNEFDFLYTYFGTYRADGEMGDDFIEDILGNAEMFARGRAGSDTLTSRGGRDVLWGGNTYKLNNCVDDLTGSPMDAMGNSDCSPYIEIPESCGAFDDMDWTANIICCACGGGMIGD